MIEQQRIQRGGSRLIAVLVSGGALIGLCAVMAFRVGVTERLDRLGLDSFTLLQSRQLSGPMLTIAQSADPGPFIIAAAVLLLVAGCMRRGWLIAAVIITLAGANLSTELVKGLLPAHGTFASGAIIAAPSFPSGHATAGMSVVLSMVLVFSGKLRLAAAGAGTVYVLALSYTLMILTSHYPSDIVAGLIMATLWALIARGALARFERAGPSAPDRSQGVVEDPLDRWLVWLLAFTLTGAGIVILTGPPQLPAAAFAIATIFVALPAVSGTFVLARATRPVPPQAGG